MNTADKCVVPMAAPANLVRSICVHLCSSVVPLLFVSSCAVGPNYDKPAVETGARYKEAGDWVVAKPSDAVPKGKWWEAFNDPTLDGLVEIGRAHV